MSFIDSHLFLPPFFSCFSLFSLGVWLIRISCVQFSSVLECLMVGDKNEGDGRWLLCMFRRAWMAGESARLLWWPKLYGCRASGMLWHRNCTDGTVVLSQMWKSRACGSRPMRIVSVAWWCTQTDRHTELGARRLRSLHSRSAFRQCDNHGADHIANSTRTILER